MELCLHSRYRHYRLAPINDIKSPFRSAGLIRMKNELGIENALSGQCHFPSAPNPDSHSRSTTRLLLETNQHKQTSGGSTTGRFFPKRVGKPDAAEDSDRHEYN
jgi:hypothetical protein